MLTQRAGYWPGQPIGRTFMPPSWLAINGEKKKLEAQEGGLIKNPLPPA